ncbi:MAG TPA: ABC transporter permease [Gryllotalpicola sp.]
MTAQDRFVRLAAEPMVTIAGDQKPNGTFAAFREIMQHREMLSLLVRRDLKSRYKDSVLGFAWSLVRPLMQLLIYFVVIGKFLRAADGTPGYAVYVFSGLTIYGFFSEIINGSTNSIIGNSGLIKKIYLPREVFPLASLGSAGFNFLVQLVILLAATVVTGAFPWHVQLLYAVLSVLLIVVIGFAFGLLLSAANVYLRDTQYLVEVGLMLLMWASPIVYQWSMVKNILGHSWLLQVYTDNPITLAVLGFQRAMWTAGAGVAQYPDHLGLRMVVALAIGVVLVFVFQRVFARVEGNFAQEI